MGKIELDHTGSGGGVTLSSDGTDLLLDGTAIGGGGGGADLYAANESSPSAQPSATGTNSIAIGDTAVSSGIDSFAFGKARATGTRSIAFNTGTNASYGAISGDCIAMGEFARASNSMSVAIGRSAYATGSQSLGLGFVAYATGNNSTSLQRGLASGADSLTANITNNTASYGASGANAIAMGYQSKATGNYAVAIGSAQATGSDYGVSIGYRARSANHSTVAIGREAGLSGSGSESTTVGAFSYASESQSLALGYSSRATGYGSTAIGRYANTGGVIGKYAFANDYISSVGDAQQGKYVLHVATTDATATALTSTGTTASSINQVILPNNSAYAFHGTIVARQQASGGTASAAWKVEGLIRREGSAGTTVLVNSATTVLDNTPSWGMALSADTTNGGLKIEATGAASTNIRWVATIHTSEVTYA